MTFMNRISAVCLTICLGTSAIAQSVQLPSDPTGAVNAQGVYLPPAARTLKDAFSGLTAMSSDPRIKKWAALQDANDLDGLLRASSADLKSDDPHPWASHVWVHTQWALGNLTETAEPDYIEGLAIPLSLEARAYRYLQQGRKDLLAGLATEAMTHPSPVYWAEYEIAYANCLVSRNAICIAMMQRLAAAFPSDFGAVYGFADYGNFAPSHTLKAFEGTPALFAGPAAPLINWVLANPAAGAMETYEATSYWLDAAPHDRNALRRAGYQLEDIKRFDAALEMFIREDDAYPFYDAAERIGRVHAAQLDFVSAKNVAQTWAQRSQPAERRALWAAIVELRILRHAGEFGRARALLLAALETHPESALLRVEAAITLRLEGFAQESVELLSPVLDKDPTHYAAASEMVRALAASQQFDDVLTLVATYREKGGLPNDQLFNNWRNALHKLSRFEEIDEVLALSLEEVPDSLWVHGNFAFSFAAAGRHDEAFDLLRDTIVKDGGSDWSIAAMPRYAAKAKREGEARDLLNALAARYPYKKKVWQELGTLNDSELAIWETAKLKAPTLGFPYVEQAYLAFKQQPTSWTKIRQDLETDIEGMRKANAPDSEIALLYNERTTILDDAIHGRQTFDLSLIPAGLADLDTAREMGLSEATYWKIRYFLIGRAGPSSERSAAGLKRAQLFPDDKDAQNHLFQADIGQYFGSDVTAMIYAYRYTQRRPRDGARLNNLAHRHNKWGGSSVVALAALEQAKRWDADANVDQETESAYGTLGAYQRFYETKYNQAENISSSQRFVNWFDNARKDARQKQITLKNLDLENMSVTRLTPEGIEEMLRYDPVTGRLVAFRIGAFEGEVTYTPDGYPTKFTIGGKDLVQFTQGPVSEDGLKRGITTLNVDGHPTINFEYNTEGKPTRIELGELGVLHVTYDENNQVSETNVELIDPETEEFQISLAVSAAFTDMHKHVQQIADIQQGNFTNFELTDPVLEGLQNQLEQAKFDETTGYTEIAQRQLALAQYMIANVGDHPRHAGRVENLLFDTFSRARYELEDTMPAAAYAEEMSQASIEAARQWRALMVKTRPDGLPSDLWSKWKEMRAWVQALETTDPETIGALARFQAELQQSAMRALSDAGWLRSSHLTNPGFWRVHARNQVVPKSLATSDLRMRDVLVRANGDVIVASNVGLSVLRRGFWEWFAFDKTARRLTTTLDYTEIDGTSNMSGLAEDNDGRLWISTRAGVIVVQGDYAGELTVLPSGRDGLFNGAVEAIALHGDDIVVGGGAGLALISTKTLERRTVSIEPVERLRQAEMGVLAIGRSALWWQKGDVSTPLLDSRVTDAMLGPDNETLYVLSGKSLRHAPWPAMLEGKGTLRGVEGQETIAATADPYGLALLEVHKGDRKVSVLTDMGGAVMGDGAFEMFQQPDTVRPVGIIDAYERDGQLFMLTAEGAAAVVRGEVTYSNTGRIYDLVSDPVLETTFIANGNEILTVDQKDPKGKARRFSGVNARILAKAPDGALITHDGPVVIRFARGSVSEEELFHTEQTLADDFNAGGITGILPASDGSVWVTAGASVFHWRQDKEVVEYSMFADPVIAPFWSDMLFGVHETPDGRILVVASNEGHRTYQATNMKGGLFEFDGKGFVETELDVLGNWFLTGFTRIDEDTAIVGTASGFARLRGNRLEEFDQVEDKSYLALKKTAPAIYLGTKGAKLGKNLWLFGSASGVVALQNNTWFYPDRLNWVLPGQADANYGARTVHAVETDAQGRIYIGTDRGLTVYDPNGAGAESFLISEQRGDFAFSALEQDRMREVNDILFDALPDDSDAGKLAEAFRKTRQKLVELEEKLVLAGDTGRPSDDIEKQILRTQQRDIALLAKLERDQPLVFNMLQLNPLDLRGLARKLPEGVVVAQYLPTETALYINLVSRDGAELKEVAVSKDKLERVTRFATQRIASEALGKTRFFEVAGAAGAGSAASAQTEEIETLAGLFGSGSDETPQALAWLYDHLLRPIEHAVPDGATLVVSQAGNLAYLPFSALVRDASRATPEYAVERFNIAAAPSLYALDMIIDAGPSTAFSHVVFGDPDGSLENARVEAESIADILSDDLVELRIGDEATYDELLSYSGDARFVHLAMHGKLDHLSPKDSYLLLAENRRMNIPQIMTLPLLESELVFLSACESGLGSDGLEYRTIAHAFAHAGAPAVIATLWQVDDAATRTLAETFYRAKMNGASNAESLAQAQRDMIAAGGVHAKPGYWAAAVLFGKP